MFKVKRNFFTQNYLWFKKLFIIPKCRASNPLFSTITPRKLHNCEKIPYVVVVVWELPSSFAVLPSGQKTEWCRDHMSQWLPRMCEYAAGFTHFPHNSANFFPPFAGRRKNLQNSKGHLYGFHHLWHHKVFIFSFKVICNLELQALPKRTDV